LPPAIFLDARHFRASPKSFRTQIYYERLTGEKGYFGQPPSWFIDDTGPNTGASSARHDGSDGAGMRYLTPSAISRSDLPPFLALTNPGSTAMSFGQG